MKSDEKTQIIKRVKSLINKRDWLLYKIEKTDNENEVSEIIRQYSIVTNNLEVCRNIMQDVFKDYKNRFDGIKILG